MHDPIFTLWIIETHERAVDAKRSRLRGDT
jgi:hypothetical protein